MWWPGQGWLWGSIKYQFCPCVKMAIYHNIYKYDQICFHSYGRHIYTIHTTRTLADMLIGLLRWWSTSRVSRICGFRVPASMSWHNLMTRSLTTKKWSCGVWFLSCVQFWFFNLSDSNEDHQCLCRFTFSGAKLDVNQWIQLEFSIAQLPWNISILVDLCCGNLNWTCFFCSPFWNHKKQQGPLFFDKVTFHLKKKNGRSKVTLHISARWVWSTPFASPCPPPNQCRCPRRRPKPKRKRCRNRRRYRQMAGVVNGQWYPQLLTIFMTNFEYFVNIEIDHRSHFFFSRWKNRKWWKWSRSKAMEWRRAAMVQRPWCSVRRNGSMPCPTVARFSSLSRPGWAKSLDSGWRCDCDLDFHHFWALYSKKTLDLSMTLIFGIQQEPHTSREECAKGECRRVLFFPPRRSIFNEFSILIIFKIFWN